MRRRVVWCAQGDYAKPRIVAELFCVLTAIRLEPRQRGKRVRATGNCHTKVWLRNPGRTGTRRMAGNHGQLQHQFIFDQFMQVEVSVEHQQILVAVIILRCSGVFVHDKPKDPVNLQRDIHRVQTPLAGQWYLNVCMQMQQYLFQRRLAGADFPTGGPDHHEFVNRALALPCDSSVTRQRVPARELPRGLRKRADVQPGRSKLVFHASSVRESGMRQPLNRPLILGSSSPYRRELLARLRIPFDVVSPQVDERAVPDESPEPLASRLALAKARAVSARYPEAIVIGSDQVADLGGEAIGKPVVHAVARAQLRRMRGQLVTFHTAVAVVCGASQFAQTELAQVRVRFRMLDDDAIERYLLAEQPYDCAGSAKSEGLGITLLDAIDSDDPTALVGLPLIRTCRLLRAAGLALP